MLSESSGERASDPSTTGVGTAASGAAEVGGGMLTSSEPATSATAVRVVREAAGTREEEPWAPV